MNSIYAWAARWGVSPEAVAELAAMMGVEDHIVGNPAATEAGIQSRVRLEASKKGARLWRNNVGACYDQDGNFIRYGLANDSKKMNDAIKSSDLIGIRPVTITPEMVGQVIGQFLAREVKRGGWKFSGTKRELAQLAFIKLILTMGGDAAFCNNEGTL
jgi:hypothetical protein